MKKISDTIKESSANYTSLALILGGTLYILGFIIVSIYYSKFGVATIDLINIRYILAGIWLLLPLALIIALYGFLFLSRQFTLFIYKSKKKRPKKKIYRRILLWIINIALVFSLLAIIWSVWIRYVYQQSYTIDYRTIVALISEFSFIMLWFWGFLIFFRIGYKGKRYLAVLKSSDQSEETLKLKNKITKTFGKSVYILKFFNIIMITSLVFWIVISVEYIFWFARDVYPHIPNYLGGGKPLIVKFISKDEKDLKQDFLKFSDSEKKVTISYNLLLDNGESYIFNSKEEHNKIIIVPKNTFNGYIIE